MSRYRTDEQGILRKIEEEARHLLYHSQRDGMDRAEHERIVQRLINELQSLIGYGTAAEPEQSGESHAFERAMTSTEEHNPVVLDVGSHVGEFLRAIEPVVKRSERSPVFHCFEPDPESFDALEIAAQILGLDVFLNQSALSDNEGTAALFSHIPGAAQACLDKPDFSHLGVEFSEVAQVRTRSLAAYCKEHDIKHIQYLKIDTEGHEFQILSAMPMRPAFIQFEFGICNVDLKVFFKDFWKMLSHEYTFSRIHPEGLIPVPEYKQELEVFHVANYLLEKRNA